MEFDLSKRFNYYFNEISKIPRGSKNEKAISDYLVSFAENHGLACKQDDILNVIITKPASCGYEDAEPVMMQAHIDMVCEKNKDVVHDFEKDPLDLYVEDGWLKARGTTLGADDGYGVAYMLSILEDDSLKHPKLTCFFTVSEEIGLIGASHLKKEDLCGKRYINLDSGNETETVVSSAGGSRAVIHCPIIRTKTGKPAYELSIRGLKGGHSGGLIHMELGNANIIAGRILKEMQNSGIDVQLVSFEGGLKYNAIPREADIVFVSDSAADDIFEACRKSTEDIKTELEFSDENFFTMCVETEAGECIEKEYSDRFIQYLFLMPNGFMHKSMAIENLTVASLNAGVINTLENEIIIQDLIRSALASHTDELIAKLEELGRLLGMTVTVGARYGGWSYSKNSEMRSILRQVLEENGQELTEKASHGGLECGIFKSLDPDLDIITYAPLSEGAHTPDEKMDLASFERSYANLCRVLELCR